MPELQDLDVFIAADDSKDTWEDNWFLISQNKFPRLGNIAVNWAN